MAREWVWIGKADLMGSATENDLNHGMVHEFRYCGSFPFPPTPPTPDTIAVVGNIPKNLDLRTK